MKDFLTIYKETPLRSTPDRASSSTLLLFLTAWRMVVTWPVFSFAEDRSRKVMVGVGMIAITKEMWMFKKFVLLGFNSSIQAVAYYGRILWSWLWSKLAVIRWYFSSYFSLFWDTSTFLSWGSLGLKYTYCYFHHSKINFLSRGFQILRKHLTQVEVLLILKSTIVYTYPYIGWYIRAMNFAFKYLVDFFYNIYSNESPFKYFRYEGSTDFVYTHLNIPIFHLTLHFYLVIV